MRNRLLDKNKNITVAVNFDHNANLLLNQAVVLAKKTDVKLNFVHCITPLINGPWGYYLPNELAAPELTRQAEENAIEAANKKFRELLENVPDEIKYSFKAMVADPVSGLLDVAEEEKTALILTATSSFPADSYFKGASTAIGLVMHAKVPVMVIKESNGINFNKDQINILVADDLQPATHYELDGAGDLIASLGKVNVEHLHVHGGFFDNINDSVSEFMAESWKALNSNNMSPKEILLREYELRKEQLDIRGKNLKEIALLKDGSYQSKVSSGEILEEIELNAEKINADGIIFGRHKFIHKSPFSFGRIPFGSMLTQNKPVIVFPNS